MRKFPNFPTKHKKLKLKMKIFTTFIVFPRKIGLGKHIPKPVKSLKYFWKFSSYSLVPTYTNTNSIWLLQIWNWGLSGRGRRGWWVPNFFLFLFMFLKKKSYFKRNWKLEKFDRNALQSVREVRRIWQNCALFVNLKLLSP